MFLKGVMPPIEVRSTVQILADMGTSLISLSKKLQNLRYWWPLSECLSYIHAPTANLLWNCSNLRLKSNKLIL